MSERVTPEALRRLADAWARIPGTYHTLVPALRAAASTIEALTAERDRRTEVLRLCVERHDAFLAEQTPLIAARMKDAFDAARAFLASQDEP